MRNIAHNSIVIGDLYVEHQLATNWVYLAVKYAPAPSEVKFVRWQRFRVPLSLTVPIIPDGLFELVIPSRSICAFVEVDLGNESHGVWQKKIEAYLRLAISGEFEAQFGRPQFRVLVIAQSTKRVERLQKLIRTYTEKVFWLTTMAQIRAPGVWSPIWLRPAGNDTQPLVGGGL